MENKNQLAFKLNSSLDILKRIRNSVKEKITVINRDLAEESIMAASELC